jgi:N-sulfoglucosamine sulfohydrolase
MPLPFAKTQLYHHSTRTPLIVRWPGVIPAGAVDERHMVSAVDFLPTLLEIIGAPLPNGLDGRSFAPLLRGQTQEGRDMVVKEYNENAGGSRDPMRAVQTKRFLYLFNAWSNGERVARTATQGTSTYRRMKELARTDPAIAARLDLFDHRVVEELYDVEQDPDCRKNLIDDPAHRQDLAELRQSLEAWMVKTNDPMLEVFRQRHDPAARDAYMAQVEKAAAERERPKAKRKAARKPKRKR